MSYLSVNYGTHQNKNLKENRYFLSFSLSFWVSTESQTPRLLLRSQSLLLPTLSGLQNLEMAPMLLSFRPPGSLTFPS
jgi:hypothetical protein